MKTLGRTLWLAAVVAAVLGYFFWTAAVSFDAFPRLRPPGHPETDHFNLLAQGFRQGHLHLAGEVPPALVAAPNPYDPRLRPPGVEVLHDASFYRGKYYIYFGPAPVVTLFLPWSVLVGRDLPVAWAVLLYCSLGFVALAVALLLVRRRHFPAAGLAAQTAALLALGGAGMIAALLRRPHIWEVSGSAGFAFFSGALLCLVLALGSRRPAVWTLAGGLLLGLAVGSRPTYLVCSPVFALPLLWRERGAYGWRALFAAAAGCTALVLALFAYNYARFADPFEFGQKYQLSSIIEGDADHFSLRYLAFNLHAYFLAPLRPAALFPFHDGIALPPLPPGHGGYEYAIGLLPNLPFALLALAGLCALRRSPVVAAFAFVAAAQSAVHLGYFGVCVRYMADFTPAFMLLAGCGLFWLAEKLPVPRLVAGAGLALAAASTAVATLALVPLYNPPPGLPPDGYRPLARALQAHRFLLPADAASARAPRAVELVFPSDRTPRTEPLVLVGADSAAPAARFAVEYLGGDRLRFAYSETGDAAPLLSPVVATPPGARHTLHLSVGGDYAGFDGRRAALRLGFDALPLWHHAAVSLPVAFSRFTLAGPPAFSGEIIAARPLAAADLPAPVLGGARVRVRFPPALADRWLPLATCGRAGAGDFLILRWTADGRAALGYDHWGEPMHLGPAFALDPAREHTFEFWLPVVHAAREVVVRLDGAPLWRAALPAFPAAPDTFYIGRNPVGGSTTVAEFPGLVLLAAPLPPPVGP